MSIAYATGGPDRYMDERGQATWNRVLALLDDGQKAAA
jgi:hypothetical protein